MWNTLGKLPFRIPCVRINKVLLTIVRLHELIFTLRLSNSENMYFENIEYFFMCQEMLYLPLFLISKNKKYILGVKTPAYTL